METNINNILSYFIKDIKDPKDPEFLKGIKTYANIQIFYKDELIYEINIMPYKYYCNHITNICKNSYAFTNNKLASNKDSKFKYLFYKNNRKVSVFDHNYIYYSYKQNKYLKKNLFHYSMINTKLIIRLHYYKGYKYFIKINKEINKFTHSLILVVNKYELHYYNRFFNLYIDRLD